MKKETPVWKRIVFPIIVIIAVFLIIYIIFSSQTQHTVNMISANPPDCSDPDTINTAIEIFKEHNGDYKNIDSDSISYIYMENTRASSYDSIVKKYECKGDVVIQPKEDGFYHSIDYCKNSCGDNNDACQISCLKNKITQKEISAYEYRCNVEYTSQLADGTKHYVTSSYDSNPYSSRNCNFNYTRE